VFRTGRERTTITSDGGPETGLQTTTALVRSPSSQLSSSPKEFGGNVTVSGSSWPRVALRGGHISAGSSCPQSAACTPCSQLDALSECPLTDCGPSAWRNAPMARPGQKYAPREYLLSLVASRQLVLHVDDLRQKSIGQRRFHEVYEVSDARHLLA
jgi:hypothetical protein